MEARVRLLFLRRAELDAQFGRVFLPKITWGKLRPHYQCLKRKNVIAMERPKALLWSVSQLQGKRSTELLWIVSHVMALRIPGRTFPR